MSKFCTNCGAVLPDDAKFCTTCGQVLAAAPQQSVPQEPQQYVPQDTQQFAPQPPQQPQQYVPQEPQQYAPQPPLNRGPVQPEQNFTNTGNIPTGNIPTGDPNWNPDTQTGNVPYVQQPVNPNPQYPGYPPQNYYPQQPQQKKSKKGLIIGLICGALALIAAAVVLILLLNRKPTINLDKYASVNFSGYDGYGTATTNFDSAKFLEENTKNFKKTEYGTKEETAAMFAMTMGWLASVDKANGLKNGDIVNLTWTLDDEMKAQIEKEFNVKLEAAGTAVTVAGLTPIGSFDPFDSLTIEYEGMDGHGYAYLNQADDEWYYEMEFEADKRDNLSNGDTITVTCSLYGTEDYFVQQYGKKPSTMTKTYTVEGLQEVEMFDPFEYIVITYEGISPNIDAEVDFTDEYPDVMNSLYPDEWYYYDLSDGDEITVTLDSYYTDDELGEYYGMIPESRSKTYTVSGEGAYLTKITDIPSDTWDDLDEAAMVEIQYETDNYFPSGTALNDAEYLGSYLLYENGNYDSYDDHNCLFMLYKFTVQLDESTTGEYYYYVSFRNLILNNDGTVDVDLSTSSSTSSTVSAGEKTFYGYESIEAFKESCIDYNAEDYDYVTDME